MDDEPFRLLPPKPPKKKFGAGEPVARQAALFTGLDCLKGQIDLFDEFGKEKRNDSSGNQGRS